MPITFVLCADDYGLAPGVGRGIRALIEAGRLSATSCMTGSPFWPEEARRLKPLDGRAHIGLHLTLTDQAPLGPMPSLAPGGRLPSLGGLLQRAMTGKLDRAEIMAETVRQLQAFEREFGRLPDFIDGHQHVHVLPIIRDVVVEVMQTRLPGRWMRCCHEPVARIIGRGVDPVRATVISRLAAPMRALATRRGIATNRGFRGAYDFSGRVPYGQLFQRFLRRADARMLVMCHPGEVDDALRAADPLTDQREAELRYFLSDDHAGDLARAGAQVGRL